MNQTPRQPDDDVRLSDEEIRAMSEDLRRQYMKSSERSYAGTVGSVVVGGIEGIVKRLLQLLRIPLILLCALAGFLLLNGREGVSFVVVLVGAVAAAIIGAAVIGAVLRFIDLRAYRRDIH